MCRHAVAGLSLTLFGGFDARLAPDARLSLPTRKAEALLAYLAINCNRPHGRDGLAALLWSDVPRAQGRHSLRQTLTAIRHMVAPRGRTLLTATRDAVTFSCAGVRVDATSFERLATRGSPRALELACILYRGDFFAGASIAETAFEEWLSAQRMHYQHLAIEAFTARLQYLTGRNDSAAAVQIALRLVALDPLQESVHRTLMRLHRDRGHIALALQQYEMCRRILAHELGVEPDRQTRDLRDELLRTRGRFPPPNDPRTARRTS